MRNRYRGCARLFFAVVLAAAAQGAGAQDWTQYYTVVHRGDFAIDWGKFYRTAEAKTMEVRKELRKPTEELTVSWPPRLLSTIRSPALSTM